MLYFVGMILDAYFLHKRMVVKMSSHNQLIINELYIFSHFSYFVKYWFSTVYEKVIYKY